MTDIVEQAARVTDGLLYGPEALVRPKGRDIAQALANAGLLAQPARTVPTRDQIAEALHLGYSRHQQEKYKCGTCESTALRATKIEALLAGQPTVAEAKAQALEEAADAFDALQAQMNEHPSRRDAGK